MANRFLGEVTVDVVGKTWTLRCDFNAMAEFETQTGKNAMQTFEAYETGGVSVSDMRAMMWAFLRRHHPEVTLAQAGDLLSEDVEALNAVIEATMPTTAEAGNVGKPKARKRA